MHRHPTDRISLPAWFAAACLLACATLTAADPPPVQSPPPQLGPPIADAVTTERLEAMLKHDEAMIVQTFRRHPSRVLPFIDGYLEGALAAIERARTKNDGSSTTPIPDSALSDFRLAVRFAALADRAFGETIFTEYAAGFASWSPQEQRRFREGQRLVRSGREHLETDPQAAFDAFRRALLLTESIGDSWGTAMAQSGIADAGRRAGRLQEAHEAAIRAVSMYGRLQMRSSQARAMLAAGRLQGELELPGGGVQYLMLARQMLPVEADPGLRREILEELLPALEAQGRMADVEKIRLEEQRRSELLGD